MLDSYEHVLGKEGVIVPGHPEESEMIEHLLSPGMQMPSSVPPPPDDQIQLIVAWIAQGAKDDQSRREPGSRRRFSSSAFIATMKLDPDIDSAAISGLRTSPKAGSNTPAAIGRAMAL